MSSEKFSIAKRVKSLRHAVRGVGVMVMRTHNAWVQFAILVLVVAAGAYVDLSYSDWVLVVLAAGFVFIAKTFNTAIEIDIDLTSPEIHPYARDVKDIAAGVVLIAAITAVVVGIIIFSKYVS